ncbi:MAG: hypothetical protein QOI38_74 [Sphingomonadales bacterium]|nr:hypothetical protein [Sphingomonadales bacterium]
MIDLAAALLFVAADLAPPPPAVAPDRLDCVSGGTQAAAGLALPPGVTRITGVARRTAARPGGRRIVGVAAGFQLRIGVMDARNTTVAGMFLASGTPEPGPPQPVSHYFGSFGRDRTGAPFEAAQPLDGLFGYVIARGDPIRFRIEIAQDGAVRLHASWDAGDGPHEAGGLVPAVDSRPTKLIVQCEVDDFSVEQLSLS